MQDLRHYCNTLLRYYCNNYGDASSVLFPKLKREEVEVAIRALGSARIFYWIRVLDIDNDFYFGSREELWLLIKRRGGWIGKFPTSSLSPVELALLAMCQEDSDEDAIKKLRVACLRDIAALDLLRAKYINH